MISTTADPTHSIWQQWRWHVVHASRTYWIAQALFLVLYLGFMAIFVLGITSPEDASAPSKVQSTLRILIDAVSLLCFTHLFIRPMLRIWFVNQSLKWRRFLLGMLYFLVLGYILLAISYAIGTVLTPRDGMNLRQVTFQAPDTEYNMTLSHRFFILVGGINISATFMLWALLYMAWQAFDGRRQLQRQVREARLRQLTHQLSPHFLFNAFNTIRGMIFEDRERAAELVTQLSELFRFHLSSDMRTEQTLAEDWELARRYLDLEVVRLESRLTLDVDINAELMDRKLPSLTLLTLVENAIKHGIAPNREGGWLRIRATPATSPFESGWSLEVGNSRGRGQAEHSTGHGLANLRERLILTHGERTTLQLDVADDRFLVRMVFPA